MKRKNRGIAVSAYLPPELHLEVQALLLDPKHGRTQYGAFSTLVTRLLKEWVEKQRKEFAQGEGGIEETHLRELVLET